jgi:hypothetical protein
LAVSTPRTWNFPHFQTISRPTSFTSLMGTCRESRQIALEFYELTPKNTSYTFVRNTIYVLRGNPLNRNSSRPEVGDVLRRVGFEDRVARMMKHLRLGMEFGKNDCRSRTPHGHAFGAY